MWEAITAIATIVAVSLAALIFFKDRAKIKVVFEGYTKETQVYYPDEQSYSTSDKHIKISIINSGSKAITIREVGMRGVNNETVLAGVIHRPLFSKIDDKLAGNESYDYYVNIDKLIANKEYSDKYVAYMKDSMGKYHISKYTLQI